MRGDLKEGDVVYFKSGSPALTIFSHDKSGSVVVFEYARQRNNEEIPFGFREAKVSQLTRNKPVKIFGKIVFYF